MVVPPPSSRPPQLTQDGRGAPLWRERGYPAVKGKLVFPYPEDILKMVFFKPFFPECEQEMDTAQTLENLISRLIRQRKLSTLEISSSGELFLKTPLPY